MNRWITALTLMLAAACQIEGPAEETETVEQAAITQDCVGGGNYTGKTLPALPLWTGATPPTATSGQIWIEVADWRPNTQSTGVGFHVAVLAVPATGKFAWGATIPDGKLGSFRAASGNRPRLSNQPRLPPCACRTCCDQALVNNWMARNLLELSLRAIDDPEHAAIAAGPLKP